MKTITQTYTIQAPRKAVWQALIDPNIIDQWGAGKAHMSDLVGETFSLWDGDIHGKNVEVIPEKTLKQEWFGGEWDKPSIVTFTLEGKGNMTTVTLLHENVPDAEAKDITDGWHRYYLGAIKQFLEKKE